MQVLVNKVTQNHEKLYSEEEIIVVPCFTTLNVTVLTGKWEATMDIGVTPQEVIMNNNVPDYEETAKEFLFLLSDGLRNRSSGKDKELCL